MAICKILTEIAYLCTVIRSLCRVADIIKEAFGFVPL